MDRSILNSSHLRSYYYACDGVRIYGNATYGYPLDCSCNATFAADADIAGLGVMIGFLLPAWITCLVAAVSAYFNFIAPEEQLPKSKRYYRYMKAYYEDQVPNRTRNKNRNIQLDDRISRDSEPSRPTDYISPIQNHDDAVNQLEQEVLAVPAPKRKRRLRVQKTVQDLLELLSDLQLLTGTAIIVAGLGQLPGISFYHEALIVNYWQLTLNSLWAAQASRKSPKVVEPNHGNQQHVNTSGKRPRKILSGTKREAMRTVAILVSVAMFIDFQIIVILREEKSWRGYEWDILTEGRCYRSHDDSGVAQQYMWLGGLGLYSVQLVLDIFDTSSRFIETWTHKMLGTSVTDRMFSWNLWNRNKIWRDAINNHFRGVKIQASESQASVSGQSNSGTGHNNLGAGRNSFVTALIVLCNGLLHGMRCLCGTILFLFFQFLAILAWGSTGYGLEVIVYFALASWTTYDIVDLKNSNKDLVVGSESSWGFGQLLPIALLSIIFYNVIDVFATEEEKKCNQCMNPIG